MNFPLQLDPDILMKTTQTLKHERAVETENKIRVRQSISGSSTQTRHSHNDHEMNYIDKEGNNSQCFSADSISTSSSLFESRFSHDSFKPNVVGRVGTEQSSEISSLNGEYNDNSIMFSDNLSINELCNETTEKDISSILENEFISKRLKELIVTYRERTSRVKARMMLPPTPSTGMSEKDQNAPSPPPLKRKIRTIAEAHNLLHKSSMNMVEVKSKSAVCQRFCYYIKKFFTLPSSLEPQSRLCIVWLFVACCSFFYNAWMVPMRTVFSEYQTDENLHIWFTLDYICDAIYIIDILLFKIRMQFLKDGSWITDPKEIKYYYFRSSRFALDLLSLLPLDLLYLFFGPISAFRFPRLFKIFVFWEFFDRLDAVLSNPTVARLTKAVLYMVYTIHINALVYYGFSKYEGIGSNSWVFQGVGHAYVRCYYFAIKTATSIGKNPKPVNYQEQALMTLGWLNGVFVFTVLIGQVRDIVLDATKEIDDYRKIKNQVLDYLARFNVPEETSDKVRMWFSYTWDTQKTLDEVECLKYLPTKLQMDMAISVHIQTLSKVQLFQDCDENLLRDLLLKLRPMIYLPGDYVCRKGEIGKEMYIVKNGRVQVVGGEDGETVFATLHEGSVFGEISLLASTGGNRRTADVRSVGYSNLFILRKEDLEVTIEYYPEAQKILERKAAKLIKNTKLREKTPEKIALAKTSTKNPKMLSAVMKITSRGSTCKSKGFSMGNPECTPAFNTPKSKQLSPSNEARGLSNVDCFHDTFSSDEDEMIVIESFHQGKKPFFEDESTTIYSLTTTPTDIKSFQSAFDDQQDLSNKKGASDVCNVIIEEAIDDFEEWLKKHSNSDHSLSILKSITANVPFIPEEERVTISYTKHEEKIPIDHFQGITKQIRGNKNWNSNMVDGDQRYSGNDGDFHTENVDNNDHQEEIQHYDDSDSTKEFQATNDKGENGLIDVSNSCDSFNIKMYDHISSKCNDNDSLSEIDGAMYMQSDLSLGSPMSNNSVKDFPRY